MSDGQLAEIDGLLLAPKTIAGEIKAWGVKTDASHQLVFKAILTLDGGASPGLAVGGSASSSAHEPWMQIYFAVKGITIERLSFAPYGFHTNKDPPWCNTSLHRLRFKPGVSRYYSWNNNRHLPQDGNRLMAEEIGVEIPDESSAIAYMLKRTNIRGSISVPMTQRGPLL